jgi:deoxyribonuclease-1-like protein
MRRLLTIVVVVALGALIFSRFQIEGWQGLRLVPRPISSADEDELPVQRQGETIRVASFHVNVLGSSKLDKTHVTDSLARLMRRFDVVALQGIRSRDDSILPRLVEAINNTGANYDFVIGPRLPRESREGSPGETYQEQYAFVFDRASLEVDRSQLYTIDDPDDLMRREPLTAWFRVRGPSEDDAFTFSLVNVHVDPDFTNDELAALSSVFTAVQGDGRGEDDVILLGNFQSSEREFEPLKTIRGVDWVITGTPTDVMGTTQKSNIVFSSTATLEYQGRGGVLDFLREFNLSESVAREVSNEMPVWAEFSILENGKPGQIASRGAERR